MSRYYRTAAALKRGIDNRDSRAEAEQEEEGEEVDLEQNERDREAQQAEQLWQQGERG